MSERKPSRWLYMLTAGVLLLGTVLVALGTRNSRDDDARANHARQDSSRDEMCPPVSDTPGLLERGATLQRMECAGCHSDDRREIGPSYEVIAARYHCRPDELIAAIGHPKPGWADYPPGPAGPPLAPDDQAALAYWILNLGGSGDE
jgi:cytochrome c551/c552